MKTIRIVIEEEKDVEIVKEKLRDIPGVTIEEAEVRRSSARSLQAALNDIPTHDISEEELYNLVQAEIDEVRTAKK